MRVGRKTLLIRYRYLSLDIDTSQISEAVERYVWAFIARDKLVRLRRYVLRLVELAVRNDLVLEWQSTR